jgi:hypothetical protein
MTVVAGLIGMRKSRENGEVISIRAQWLQVLWQFKIASDLSRKEIWAMQSKRRTHEHQTLWRSRLGIQGCVTGNRSSPPSVQHRQG